MIRDRKKLAEKVLLSKDRVEEGLDALSESDFLTYIYLCLSEEIYNDSIITANKAEFLSGVHYTLNFIDNTADLFKKENLDG